MSMLAYVNGQFVPEADARISIFDRGFLFGDGVYEVTPIIDGRLVDRAAHLERLGRSLRELRIEPPVPLTEIDRLQAEIMTRNGIQEGRVYLQVTRGPAERDFGFPKSPQPSLVLFGRHVAVVDNPTAQRGLKVMTLPDLRWRRRDIKSVMLLASVLAKQTAVEAGFDDAWLVEDGLVTEGSSNNAYIVQAGRILTRHLSNDILAGCTRRALLNLVAETGIELVEQAFAPEAARAAEEAFITSATNLVMPVVQIDDAVIGDGKPGPVARRLRAIYIEHARAG